jgi:hypothetical protein
MPLGPELKPELRAQTPTGGRSSAGWVGYVVDNFSF